MNVSPLINRATLREGALAQLREAIVTGAIAPGMWLKDAELSAQLGLSATPVREAMMQLAAEGLVEIEPNRLKRVSPIDLEAMVELLEVQHRLWALGYLWGAPKVGPDELAQLRRIYASHVRAIEAADTAAAIAAAHAFHLVLMTASGNRELVRVSTDRLSLIRRFVFLSAPWMVSETALAQHGGMLAALERGDVELVNALFDEAGGMLIEAAKALRNQAQDDRAGPLP